VTAESAFSDDPRRIPPPAPSVAGEQALPPHSRLRLPRRPRCRNRPSESCIQPGLGAVEARAGAASDGEAPLPSRADPASVSSGAVLLREPRIRENGSGRGLRRRRQRRPQRPRPRGKAAKKRLEAPRHRQCRHFRASTRQAGPSRRTRHRASSSAVGGGDRRLKVPSERATNVPPRGGEARLHPRIVIVLLRRRPAVRAAARRTRRGGACQPEGSCRVGCSSGSRPTGLTHCGQAHSVVLPTVSRVSAAPHKQRTPCPQFPSSKLE
jgi:hypothetical protein